MKTLTARSIAMLAAGAAHADVFNLGPGLTEPLPSRRLPRRPVEPQCQPGWPGRPRQR